MYVYYTPHGNRVSLDVLGAFGLQNILTHEILNIFILCHATSILHNSN